MKKMIASILAVTGAVVGYLVSVDVDVDIRIARISGDCSELIKTLDKVKCDHVEQRDGFCLCWTNQEVGSVDDEIADFDSLPVAKKRRLVVCEVTDEQTKVTSIDARWELADGPLSKGCVLASESMVDIATAQETDLTKQLKAKCGDWVKPREWFDCPRCLHPKTPPCRGP